MRQFAHLIGEQCHKAYADDTTTRHSARQPRHATVGADRIRAFAPIVPGKLAKRNRSRLLHRHPRGRNMRANVPQEALSGAGSSLQAEAAYRSDGLAAECVSRQREGWHFGRSALSRLAGRFIFYWADLPKEWNRQRASALHACWRSRPSLKTRLAGEPVAPDSSPVGKAASPQGRPFHYLGQIDHDQRSRSRSLVR
jgi:hypothetical protein